MPDSFLIEDFPAGPLELTSHEVVALSLALYEWGQCIDAGVLHDPGEEVFKVFMRMVDKVNSLAENVNNLLPPENQYDDVVVDDVMNPFTL